MGGCRFCVAVVLSLGLILFRFSSVSEILLH